ncbi:hypothetical protein HYQ46_003598 [Verticillium longisporum]|nr:hypothetical protein HYQ46_003598 [Verticillium longisporum]
MAQYCERRWNRRPLGKGVKDEAETTLLSSHVSRRDGYTRMPSDGAIDISSFEQRLSPSPSPDQGLGISSFSSTPRRPISRVPVGSKTSSPVSARYYHGLLSSPQETHSDERQAVTPDMGDSPIFEPPGLGISSFSSTPRRPISRVPVGSKTSSPVSPRSYHGLMSSPQETQHDERQARTPDMGDSPTFESPVDSPKGTRTSSRLRKWFSGTWSKAAPPAYDMAEQQSPNFSRPPPQRDEETALRLGDRDGMGEHSSHSSPADDDDANEECDKPLHERYRQVPNYCSSTKDVHKRRVSWLSVSILTLSVYSTALSCLWFIIAIVQPRWGRAISSNGGIAPATASVVCTLFAKTIEMSFVTVFISFLGQVLSRRAFVKKSRGMTLAEMTMRNWVIQPGSLITHWETIPYAGVTFLGVISLAATVAATFYTTASEAMITPKIKFGGWEHKVLQGHVRSQYANPFIVCGWTYPPY